MLFRSDHLHSVFDLSSSDDDEDEQLVSPCSSSNIEDAVTDVISQVHVYPDLHPASRHRRLPSEHSDEDTSSGSDGGEEYSPSHFDESSSDEEEGLNLEHVETWELISI